MLSLKGHESTLVTMLKCISLCKSLNITKVPDSEKNVSLGQSEHAFAPSTTVPLKTRLTTCLVACFFACQKM